MDMISVTPLPVDLMSSKENLERGTESVGAYTTTSSPMTISDQMKPLWTLSLVGEVTMAVEFSLDRGLWFNTQALDGLTQIHWMG